MLKQMEISLVFICCWFIWYLFLITIRDENGGMFYGLTTQSIIGQYQKQYQIPTTHIILKGKTITSRPISGDHIHMAISIWIGNTARQAEHDRPIHQPIPYESLPTICTYPGEIAYTKIWPHLGIHTHCDGLIHIHPWSAPQALRQEGRKVVLGVWFDQVGIKYRQHSLEFLDGQRYDNNATHRWRIAEYICYNNSEYTLYEDHFDEIWLGHAYGSYIVWYGTSSDPPPSIASHIDRLTQVGATGFDGHTYPHKCGILL